MAWLKVHTDILGDAKLMRGVRGGLKGLELVPWLLIFAKQADDEGRLSIGALPATGEDLAPLIPGVKAPAIDACLQSCVALGVLEVGPDDVPFFPNWARRQGKPADMKDRVRERMRKSRERRNSDTPEGSNVTPLTRVTSHPPTSMVPRVTVTPTEETEEKDRKKRLLTAAENGVENSEPWPIRRAE